MSRLKIEAEDRGGRSTDRRNFQEIPTRRIHSSPPEPRWKLVLPFVSAAPPKLEGELRLRLSFNSFRS
jgi:hypothetical protein